MGSGGQKRSAPPGGHAFVLHSQFLHFRISHFLFLISPFLVLVQPVQGGGVGQASRVSIIAESGQGSPVETRTFFH